MKRQNKPIVIRVSRHSISDKGALQTDFPLTDEGKRLAFEMGKDVTTGYRVKAYHSGATRNRETAQEFVRGARQANPEGKHSVQENKKFGPDFWFLDKVRREKMRSDFNSLEFTQKWIERDPRILKVLPPWEKVADGTLKEMKPAQESHKRGEKGIMFAYFTHQRGPELLLLRLTGLRFDKDTMPKNTMCRANEALELIFDNDKIILKYRNIERDVTKKFNEIVRE